MPERSFVFFKARFDRFGFEQEAILLLTNNENGRQKSKTVSTNFCVCVKLKKSAFCDLLYNQISDFD